MSGLPKGLYKRHRSYYVRHKQDGEWKLTNVGQDLGEALERHVNLRTGREFPKDAITLPLIVERYLKHHELYSKRKTQEYVRLTSARLVRFFRSRPIDSLSEEDLETFIGYRLETVQPISVNADLRVLKAILRLGVQQGLIEQMPFKIRMLKVTKRRIAHIFSPEEIKRLLDAAGPRERALIIICSATGIRLEEALHLQWGDIDWDKRKLSIRAKEGWSPKSHQERSMFVPRTVITYLGDYRASLQENRDEDWIFQSSLRKGQRLTNPWKPIRKTFQRAGLYRKGKLTHELRRTVATTMLTKGIGIHIVKEILGHSTITTTELYAYAQEDAMRDAADRLGLL